MRNTATATASDGVGKEQSRRELRLGVGGLARRLLRGCLRRCRLGNAVAICSAANDQR